MTRRRARATRRRPRRGTRNGAVLSTDIASARRISQGNVYRCIRTVNVGVITAPTIDAEQGRNFRLADLPNSSDFTNLFDQYRIVAVECIYVFSSHILAANSRYPRITFAVDYSDSTSPANEAEVLQYQNAEMFQFGQVRHTFKRVIRPRAAMAAFEGAFTGYGMASPNQWFDTNDSSVQYYGTKEWMAFYNTTTNTGSVINVYHRYHLEFKNAR